MFFLQQLKKITLLQEIVSHFYITILQSILTVGWFKVTQCSGQVHFAPLFTSSIRRARKMGGKSQKGLSGTISPKTAFFFHWVPNGKRHQSVKKQIIMPLLSSAFPRALSISTKQQLRTNPPPGNSWTLALTELYPLDNPVTVQFNTSSPAVH